METDNERNAKAMNILVEMQNTYKEFDKYYNSSTIPKPKDNIYKHVGASLRNMKTTGFVQDTQELSADDILKYLVVAHLVDNISMRGGGIK